MGWISPKELPACVNIEKVEYSPSSILCALFHNNSTKEGLPRNCQAGLLRQAKLNIRRKIKILKIIILDLNYTKIHNKYFHQILRHSLLCFLVNKLKRGLKPSMRYKSETFHSWLPPLTLDLAVQQRPADGWDHSCFSGNVGNPPKGRQTKHVPSTLHRKCVPQELEGQIFPNQSYKKKKVLTISQMIGNRWQQMTQARKKVVFFLRYHALVDKI